MSVENFSSNFLGLLATSSDNFSHHYERAPQLQIPTTIDNIQSSFYPYHAQVYDPSANFLSTIDNIPVSQEESIVNSTPLIYDTGNLTGDGKASRNCVWTFFIRNWFFWQNIKSTPIFRIYLYIFSVLCYMIPAESWREEEKEKQWARSGETGRSCSCESKERPSYW